MTTMTREEIDPENRARNMRDLQRALAEADIGPLLMSAYPLEEDSLSAIAVYRRLGAKPFTQRESRIAHIILSEVPWLHMAGWPEDRGAKVPELYPQQRIVLNLLIEGLPRKAIAHHLALSENTVAGYARDVFRHFGVHSQAELMRKFLTGNPAS